MPILDGSSASFVFLLQSAGVELQNVPKRFIRVTRPVEVREGEGHNLKWARLEPYHGFKLRFEIDFAHPAVDSTGQSVEFDLGSGNYARAIARARTFGFTKDVEMLRTSGLALGRLPLSQAAIERAIELNGVQVEMNRKAFHWGRCIAVDPDRVDRMLTGGQVIEFQRKPGTGSLDELVARRMAYLTEYQDERLARRYKALVDRVAAADTMGDGRQELAIAVAQAWFKLLAVKDEWEVARLFASEDFRKEIEQTFNGDYKLHFHIGGWPFARKDPHSGKPVKREVGPWLMHAFRVMARLRGLRGTILDPFRNGEERQLERALVAQYERDVADLLGRLDAGNYRTAVAIASLPLKIRGYGHVKKGNAESAAAERERLLAAYSSPAREVRRVG